MIMFLSGSKTYFDNYFPFSDAKKRYDNSLVIYRGSSVFSASKILRDENIDLIFLSEQTKTFYGVDKLNIVRLGTCINILYDEEVLIYSDECKIS